MHPHKSKRGPFRILFTLSRKKGGFWRWKCNAWFQQWLLTFLDGGVYFRWQPLGVIRQGAAECYFEAARKICRHVAIYIPADSPLIANNFTGAYFSTSAGRYYSFQWVSLLFGTRERTTTTKSKHCLLAWFSPNPFHKCCLAQHYQALWLLELWEFTRLKRIFLSSQSFHLKRSLQHQGAGGLFCLGGPARLQEQGTVGGPLVQGVLSSSFAHWKEESLLFSFLYQTDPLVAGVKGLGRWVKWSWVDFDQMRDEKDQLLPKAFYRNLHM